MEVYGKGQLPEDYTAAVLLIDKPLGWTSFQVIRVLRRILSVRKIGHAGTLDPMATGLLICLVGRATRTMETFMHMPKLYTGTLRLGEETPSYDAETAVNQQHAWTHITANCLERARRKFVGDIWQIPPMYSAIKIGGERLYKKARRGEIVQRSPHRVHIERFELTRREGQDVSFVVTCSKGTYIRSLAHDMGQVLGVGAHLIALRREAIGPYTVMNAWDMQALEDARRQQ